jgi:transposase
MVYVGIDIAKRVYMCAILDESNTVVVKPFKFRNDVKGFKKLLVHLERLGLDPSDILIGMEATGLNVFKTI